MIHQKDKAGATARRKRRPAKMAGRKKKINDCSLKSMGTEREPADYFRQGKPRSGEIDKGGIM